MFSVSLKEKAHVEARATRVKARRHKRSCVLASVHGRSCQEGAGQEAGKAVCGQWGPVEGLIRRMMRRRYLCLSHCLILLFSCLVMADCLQPHGLQHTRLPCPSLFLRTCSDSCPLSQWCHLTISSSIIPFSSCLQSFPTSGGQSTGASASASVSSMNSQGWFPLGLTGLTSLLSKGLSRVFSHTTVQKHQFFGTQPSL